MLLSGQGVDSKAFGLYATVEVTFCLNNKHGGPAGLTVLVAGTSFTSLWLWTPFAAISPFVKTS